MSKPATEFIQHIPQVDNAVKILLLILMLLGCFDMMDALATRKHSLGYLLFFLLALFASMLMLAMAILSHEGTHRVLFKNLFINDLAAGLLAALGGGVPFYSNRQFHLIHHSYAHQGKDDPEQAMHGKPFWQALLLGSFIGLFLQYRILLRNLFELRPEHKFRLRSIKDIAFIAVALWFYSQALPMMDISPLYSIVPTFLLFPFTFTFRAMSDHYGLPKVKRKSETSQRKNGQQQISGWVIHTPFWLEWLWSHVNYHEVHHRFPYLSHIHLKAAYEASKYTHPYATARGYTRSLLAQRQRHYYQGPRSADK
jgi:fatty acid desaturase